MWADQARARSVGQELSQLRATVDAVADLERRLDDFEILIELAGETPPGPVSQDEATGAPASGGLDPAELEAEGRAVVAALRKLTWSDQLPVTVIGDSVVVGTDYAALIALLGPSGRPPAGGSAQHRHGIAEAGA